MQPDILVYTVLMSWCSPIPLRTEHSHTHTHTLPIHTIYASAHTFVPNHSAFPSYARADSTDVVIELMDAMRADGIAATPQVFSALVAIAVQKRNRRLIDVRTASSIGMGGGVCCGGCVVCVSCLESG